MLEVTATEHQYLALVEGRLKHHVMLRTVGVPNVGDPIRISEVGLDGWKTGKAAWARVTFVELIRDAELGPISVLSVELRMSSERAFPALGRVKTEPGV